MTTTLNQRQSDRHALEAGDLPTIWRDYLGEILVSRLNPISQGFMVVLRERSAFWNAHNPYDAGSDLWKQWDAFTDRIKRLCPSWQIACLNGLAIKKETQFFLDNPPVWNGEKPPESPSEATDERGDTSHAGEPSDASGADDSGATERVLSVLEKFGASTARETAARIRGLDSRAVNATLARLEKMGRVTATKEGRKVLYTITG